MIDVGWLQQDPAANYAMINLSFCSETLGKGGSEAETPGKTKIHALTL